jgi:hypothetical protein
VRRRPTLYCTAIGHGACSISEFHYFKPPKIYPQYPRWRIFDPSAVTTLHEVMPFIITPSDLLYVIFRRRISLSPSSSWSLEKVNCILWIAVQRVLLAKRLYCVYDTVACTTAFRFFARNTTFISAHPCSAWRRLYLIHLSLGQGSPCTASMTESLSACYSSNFTSI